jgi:hypothetical protein
VSSIKKIIDVLKTHQPQKNITSFIINSKEKRLYADLPTHFISCNYENEKWELTRGPSVN